jgi:hypothetical protein
MAPFRADERGDHHHVRDSSPRERSRERECRGVPPASPINEARNFRTASAVLHRPFPSDSGGGPFRGSMRPEAVTGFPRAFRPTGGFDGVRRSA